MTLMILFLGKYTEHYQNTSEQNLIIPEEGNLDANHK